ncbi:hypothetical protein [Salinispira pacifica]|uniref:DUF1145 domain-containing protein n=1 Tax=Salinispira pacifica TaxID=1307761 RepID=V5WF67_9SPIO|nr:hypothetical protein [Salinispira pacifica]AHC13821.1 hypothetical protein L21SP2_0389 [Salinispira pacifica]
MRRFLKIGAIIGWAYILAGLASRFAVPDAPEWLFPSASTAGAVVVLIHLLELPLGYKNAKSRGIPPWKATLLTLIFGVLWMKKESDG